jgi:AcrR family transcriptional regulator
MASAASDTASGGIGSTREGMDAFIAAEGYLEGYAVFDSIDAQKRLRVVSAALEEFCANDYANVSTNTIVKKAEISKGLLFHYFTNKVGLYCYLHRYAHGLIAGAVFDEVDMGSGDVFDILWRTTEVKLRVARQFPVPTRFYVRSFVDRSVPDALKALFDESTKAAFGMLWQIAASIDEGLLKDGLDKQMAAKVFALVCEGLTNEILEELTADVSIEYWQERTRYVEGYFGFMRQLLYKEAGQGEKIDGQTGK